MGQATEHGWVIEKGDIGSPEYFMIGDVPGWSEPGEHLKAFRFEREEDAEAFASAFIIGVTNVGRDDIRIAQHGWG